MSIDFDKKLTEITDVDPIEFVIEDCDDGESIDLNDLGELYITEN